jgi:hypothetical protein
LHTPFVFFGRPRWGCLQKKEMNARKTKAINFATEEPSELEVLALSVEE